MGLESNRFTRPGSARAVPGDLVTAAEFANPNCPTPPSISSMYRSSARPLTRRGVLRGLLATTLAASFPLWNRNDARGAPGGTAKRLVVFFTPNGTVHRHRRPTGGTLDFDFAAGSILEPLRPNRRDLVVIDGLDFKGVSNHEGGMAAMLTGGGGATSESRGMSIDQFVAAELAADTRFASLELGVQTSAWGAGVQTRMSYTGASTYASPVDDPAETLRRIFGAAGATPEELDAVALGRRSILDNARAEVTELRGRVPTRERAKLDIHLDAIRAMERGLSPSGGGAACSAPTLGSFDPYANAAFPTVGRAQMDLLVAALACDATRVASIQWAHTVAPHVFSWTGTNEGHHALSHMDDGNAAGVAAFVAAERWFSEQFKYLIDRLAALPEGTGTMLDNTLVVWAKEMGDSRLHVCTDVPFVLAGGAGGALSPGRYINAAGAPHQKLLVSICQAMGLSNRTFGDASVSTGALGGLS